MNCKFLKTMILERSEGITIDDEPWFVGKDVALILGYTNPSKALADHVDEDDKLNNESLSSLGQRGGWIINESGLYSLIISSKLPTAKKFKHWVTSDVLPSIRKHGAYMRADIIDKVINNPDFGIRLLTELSGIWCPYADYKWQIEKEYCDYKSYEDEHKKPCLKWTEKGRKWILDNYDKWAQYCA